MSSDSGGVGALGGLIFVGLVYWVAVFTATVVAITFVGLAAVAIAVVLYLVMGGLAFAQGVTSGDWGVVRDAILAPAIGVFAGVFLADKAADWVYSAITAPNAIYDWAAHQNGLVTLIVMLGLMFLLLALLGFYIAGLGFGLIVASDRPGVRLFGYAACLLYGLTYSGTYLLVSTGRLDFT